MAGACAGKKKSGTRIKIWIKFPLFAHSIYQKSFSSVLSQISDRSYPRYVHNPLGALVLKNWERSEIPGPGEETVCLFKKLLSNTQNFDVV